MKKLSLILLAIVITFAMAGNHTNLNRFQSIAKEKEDFFPNQLIIGYNDDCNREEVSKQLKVKYNLNQVDEGIKGNFEVVEFAEDKKMDDLMEFLKHEKEVKYVEPNYIASSMYDPNDPYYASYQWSFFQPGSTYKYYPTGTTEYVSDYGIKAELAWNLFKPTNTATGAVYPGEGIKIAILDTGVAYEDYTYSVTTKVKGKKVTTTYVFKVAPDLVGTTFDKALAKNFYTWPNTTHANDDHYHGTHVCGTIAQATDSSTPYGCAGIAYKATIIPIKVLGGPDGTGSYTAIANGIYWAADKGAKIINMSLGGAYNSSTMYTAIKYAYDKGVLIVCAAGNSGDTSAPGVIYPAAYNECIAVAATDMNGARCAFSSYGPEVDIAAPGYYILQQTLNAKGDTTNFAFHYLSGTSMATPHVAATAALIMALHPTYTRDQVRSALLSTARDLGTANFDNYYGNGLLDANAAVNWVP